MKPDNTARPKLKAPPGTCDTHMHIYDRRYPKAATARIDAPDAPVSDYLKVRERLGIERIVVVQPSTYGTDNRCTIEAMKALGAGTRGVAVVDQTVTDAELDRLTGLGIRGIRFFMLPGGALPWDILETMAARVAPFGWHVQLQLDGRQLPDYEAVLARLPCDLVIDHVGKFLEPVPVEHPSFRALERLVGRGARVKLSAPYEVSKATTMSELWPRRWSRSHPIACCGRQTGRTRPPACPNPMMHGCSTCCSTGFLRKPCAGKFWWTIPRASTAFPRSVCSGD